MATIYNFLDYKYPKRRTRKFLISGWILAFLSLFTFTSLSLSLILGALAIVFGSISNYRSPKAGTKLILCSMAFMLSALGINFFLNGFIKLIMDVFFITA